MPHTSTRKPSVAWKVFLIVVLAGILPILVAEGSDAVLRHKIFLFVQIHNALELSGACVAMVVALLLLLRARHESACAHLVWIVAGLIAMGVMDFTHALSVEGRAWSWLRHGSTFFGGVLFASVWLPVPRVLMDRRRIILMTLGLFLALASVAAWAWQDHLPVPWVGGDYTPGVKLLNALGGLGFLASSVFFLRRFLKTNRPQELVFASVAMMFADGGLLFGFSQRWTADWWCWHFFRLTAYGIVLVAAYDGVMALYRTISQHSGRLEEEVRARTSELQSVAAFPLENPSPVIRARPDGTVLFTNRASMESFTGLSLEVGGRLPEEMISRIRPAFEVPGVHEMEMVVGRRTILFSLVAFPERDYINFYGRDITDRKTNERKLAQQARLLDLSNDAILVRDAEGRILFWNAGAEKVYGFTRDEAIGTISHDLLRTEFPEPLRAIQEYLQAEKQWSGELVQKRKDGAPLVVYSRWVLNQKDPDRPMSILETNSDITKAKQAEEDLRTREREQRLLIDAVPALIAYIDKDKRYRLANRQYELWFQQKPAEIPGKTMVEVLGAEAAERLEPYVNRALSGEDVQFEVEAPYERGNARWIHAHYVPNSDQDGRVAGFFVLVLDITERRHAQEELRKQAERQALLLEVTGSLVASGHDEASLARLIFEMAGGHLKADLGFNYRLDPSGSSLNLVAGFGIPEKYRPGAQTQALGQAFCGTVAATRAPLSADHEQILCNEKGAFIRQMGARAYACHPLLARDGRLLGTFSMASTRRESFTPGEIDFLHTLCHFIALAWERLEAERALKIEQERSRIALMAAQLGIWENDVDSGQMIVDARAREHCGLDKSPISEMEFLSSVHPEDRALIAQIRAKGMDPNTNAPIVFDYRVVHKDGSTHWLLVHGHVQFEERDGVQRAVRAIGTTQDITSRRESEEALHRANQRLEYHIQNTPLGVVEFDSDFNVMAWSDGAKRIFGWDSSETCGKGVWDIPWILDEDRPVLKKVVEDLRTGRTVRNYSPNRNITKTGQLIWCEWYNSCLVGASGKIESVQSLVLDVTDRTEAEEALRMAQRQLQQHANTLEKTVLERTQKLQELVGELEHFSYTITHDMRAPLRAISGFADLANEMCADANQPELKSFLRRIIDSTQRMDLLITDSLSYSKTVRQELPLAPVEVGKLLRGMLDSYPEFQGSKAKILLEGEIPTVMGNEAALTQCFSNLLGNAVKFVQPGKVPEVRVWGSRDGDIVKIYVEDKGIGIAPRMLPRVFDMFSRGHTSNEYPGTGIGLALVRKVVERMDGKVGVQSELGMGTRFCVELKSGDLLQQGS